MDFSRFRRGLRGSSQEPEGDSSSADGSASSASAPQASQSGLAAAPQPSKILQDVLDCIESLKTSFEEDGMPIDDNNQTLHRLCAKLEFLLQVDMKDKKTITGRKKDYWEYFCDCLAPLKGVNDGIKYVKTTGDCKTSLGKGRAFLRFCLMHHRLADGLQACCTNGKVTSAWYLLKSIWLQHDKSNTVISALYDLNDLVFDLAPRGYDLDNSWPSFARGVTVRKTNDGMQTWALSERARTMSISSLNSVGQESLRGQMCSTPNDPGMESHLVQELAIAETMRSDLEDRVEALSQERVQFQQSVAQSRGEVNMMETQVKDLQTELKELRETHRDLEKRYDKLCMESEVNCRDGQTRESTLETTLSELRDNNQSLQERLHQLQEDLQLSLENLSITATERDSVKAEVSEMGRKIAEMEDGIASSEEGVRDKMLQLQAESEKYRQLLQEKDSEGVHQLEAKVAMETELTDQRSFVVCLEKKLSALTTGYQWLNTLHENAEFREIPELDATSTLTLKDVSHFILGLQDKVANTQGERERLGNEVKQLVSSNMELQQNLSASTEKVKTVESFIAKLQDNEESLKQKVAKLEESLQLNSQNLHDMKMEEGLKSKSVTELQNQIIEYSSKLENMSTLMESKTDDLNKLTNSKEEVQQQLKQVTDELSRTKQDHSEAKESVQEQGRVIEEKVAQLAEYETAKQELEDNMKSLTGDNKTLQATIHGLNESLANVENEIKSVSSQKEALGIEIGELRSAKGTLEHDLEHVRERLEEAENRLVQSTRQWEKEKETSQTLLTKIDELNADVRHQQEQFMKEKDEVSELLQNEKSTNSQLQRETLLLKEKLTNSENAVERLTESENRFTKKVEQLEKDVNTKALLIVSLEKDVDMKTKESENMASENGYLKTEVKSFQDQFYDKQSETLLLNEKILRNQEELERTKQFYETAAKTESDLSDRFKSLENTISLKDERITELTEEEKSLSLQINKIQRDKEDLERQLNKVENDMDYLKKGYNEKESQANEMKLAVSDLNVEKDSIQRKLYDTEAKLNVKEEEITKLQSVIEEDLKEQSRLEQIVTEMNNKESRVSKANRQLEQQIFDTEQTHKILKQTIEQMQKDFDVTVSDKDKLDGKVSILEEQSGDNKCEIERLNTEYDQVIEKQGELQATIQEKEANLRNEETRFENLQIEFEVVTKDKYELEETIETLEKQIQSAESVNENLTDTVNVTKEELEGAVSKIAEYQGMVEKLESEQVALKESFDELQSENNNLNKKLEEAGSVVASLQQQLNDFQDQLESKSKQLAIAETDLDSLKSTVTELKDENERVENEKSDIEKHCQKLSDDILVLQEKECNNVDAIKKVEECVQKSELEKESIHGALSLKCVEINELQARFDDFQSENACLVQEYDLLQQMFNDLKETEEVVRSKLSEMTASRDEEKNLADSLHDQLKQLKEDYSAVVSDKSTFLEEKQQLSLDIEELTGTIASVQDEKTQLEKRFDDVCTVKERLDVQLDDATAEIVAKTGEIEAFDTQMKELHSILRARETEIEHLETRLNESSVKCDGLENSVKKVKCEVDSKNKTIEELKALTETKESDIDNLNREITEASERQEKLKEALFDSEKLHSEVHNTVTEKVEQLEKSDNERQDMQAIIAELTRDKEQIMLDYKTERQQTQALQTKNDSDGSCITELKNALSAQKEQATNESQRLELEIQDLMTKSSDLIEEKHKLSEEKAGLVLEVGSLTEMLNNKVTELGQVNSNLSQLSSVKTELEAKYGELTSFVKNMENKLTETEVEKARYEADLKHINNELEVKQTELESKFENVVKELQQTQEQLEQTMSQLETAMKDNEGLSAGKANAESVHEQLKEEFKVKVSDLEAEVSKLENEVGVKEISTKELNEQLESEKVKNETEKSELRESIAELTNMVTSSEEKVQEIEAKYTADTNDLESEIKRLNCVVCEKGDASSNLASTLETANAEIMTLKEKLQILDGEMTTKEGNLQISIDRNKELELEMEQFSRQLDESEQLQQHSIQELQDLREKLKNVEVEKAEVQGLSDSLKTELEEKASELATIQESLKEKEGLLESIESDNERKAADSEAEVDSLRQEVSALEFQLSSKQLEFEQSQQSAMNETEFTEMKDKVMEQETVIEELQQEMAGLKEIAVKYKEQDKLMEQLNSDLDTMTSEKATLSEQLAEVKECLDTEMSSSSITKSALDEEQMKHTEALEAKDREIQQLKDDMGEMKKKLVKLIREKDTLWQKSDKLSFQQKLQASEKWVDDSQVTHCLGCSTEFSFTLRKHHCRLCGRIFCHNCSSNWVYTASSSKKSRACISCYIRCNEALKADSSVVDSDLEQSVDIPKCQVLGLASPPTGMNSSATSSCTSLDQDMDPGGSASGTGVAGSARVTRKLTFEQASVTSTSTEGSNLLSATSEAGGGNETDEEKLKDSSGAGATKSEDKVDSGEDKFHLISDEEIQRSFSVSDGAPEEEAALDPSMSCSVGISLEELERGEINSQNEVWIKAGKSFAVPVLITKQNMVFGWEFTSYPKDVVFSVVYRLSQSMPISDGQVLVPPCKCDSHKQATKGEVSAKQLGVYTLIFDNTYSKLTSKRVNYTLLSLPTQDG